MYDVELRLSEVDSIIRKDCRDHDLTSDSKEYLDQNRYQYTVVMNTWLHLVCDLSSDTACYILRDLLINKGFITTISEADSALMEILHQQPLSGPYAAIISSTETMKDAINLLRFPKRFSPLSADLLERKTISDFKVINNGCKLWSRLGLSQFLHDELRIIVHDLLRDIDLSDIYLEGYFSNGAVSDADKCLASKFAAWDYPYYLDWMYPVNSKCIPKYIDFQYANVDIVERGNKLHECVPLDRNSKTAKGVCVPKSYKAARLIAEESATRQYFMQGVRQAIEDCFANNPHVAFNHQEHQQSRVATHMISKMQGEGIATADASSASDRFAYALFADIFPQELVNTVRELRSSTVILGNNVDVTHMVATSGSAVCFALETVMFYAISILATELAQYAYEEELADPSVYGDDTILDSRAFDTYCDLMHRCGFRINTDKSYTDAYLFKEACGTDFYDGEDVTSVYWPRNTITKDIDSYVRLVSLNNRLVSVSNKGALVYINNVLRSLAKELRIPFSQSSIERYIDKDVTDVIGFVDITKPCIDKYDGTEVQQHTVSSSKWKGKRVKMNEMYYYVEFLKTGPKYEDPFMELLGVSMPLRSPSDEYSQCETLVKWDGGVLEKF